MTFAQRSKGESRQKTSEYLKEDVRSMLLCWANVRRGIERAVPDGKRTSSNGNRGSYLHVRIEGLIGMMRSGHVRACRIWA